MGVRHEVDVQLAVVSTGAALKSKQASANVKLVTKFALLFKQGTVEISYFQTHKTRIRVHD